MLRIPQARFSVRYDVSKALPDGWTGTAPLELASGPGYTFHGDFMNAWDPEAAENMLTQITDKREFQTLTGSFAELPNCEAKDADPENGTSDWQESIDLLNAAPEPETVEESEAVESSPATITVTVTAAPSAATATVTQYVTVAPTECL